MAARARACAGPAPAQLLCGLPIRIISIPSLTTDKPQGSCVRGASAVGDGRVDTEHDLLNLGLDWYSVSKIVGEHPSFKHVSNVEITNHRPIHHPDVIKFICRGNSLEICGPDICSSA